MFAEGDERFPLGADGDRARLGMDTRAGAETAGRGTELCAKRADAVGATTAGVGLGGITQQRKEEKKQTGGGATVSERVLGLNDASCG